MIYIFDVDGTLTKPRNPIDPEFKIFFKEFIKNNRVWLISGSDKDKTIEQVGSDIWHEVERAYQCSGNQQFEKGKLINEKTFELPYQLNACLEKFLKNSKYPYRYGNHIEERQGTVNFSIVGRDCTQEQRDHYSKWEEEHQERKEFAWEIKNRFPWIDAVVGGEMDEPYEFFGDRLELGGNDYPILRETQKCQKSANLHNIKTWRDTETILHSRI